MYLKSGKESSVIRFYQPRLIRHGSVKDVTGTEARTSERELKVHIIAQHPPPPKKKSKIKQ